MATNPDTECESIETIDKNINSIFLDVAIINQYINKTAIESDTPLGSNVH